MRQCISFTHALRITFFLCFIAIFAINGASAQDAPETPDKEVPSETQNKKVHAPVDDLEDIPDEYIEEAWNFNQYCRSEPKLSRYQNCECLASMFLDKRIEAGPKTSRSSILLAIEGQCPDATNEAGRVYTECLGDGPIMPAETPLKKFCKCYASTYTKLFEATKSKTGTRTLIRLRTQSMTICRDPALAKQIYPNAVALSR